MGAISKFLVPLEYQIFSNCQLSISAKVTVYYAVVISILLYGAH